MLSLSLTLNNAAVYVCNRSGRLTVTRNFRWLGGYTCDWPSNLVLK
jgi:hypothetical protein